MRHALVGLIAFLLLAEAAGLEDDNGGGPGGYRVGRSSQQLGEEETLPQRLISVETCPSYVPHCGNVARQGGARVGDKCATACRAFGDGAMWCPTTLDHSGRAGTPWGWCSPIDREKIAFTSVDRSGDDESDRWGNNYWRGKHYVEQREERAHGHEVEFYAEDHPFWMAQARFLALLLLSGLGVAIICVVVMDNGPSGPAGRRIKANLAHTDPVLSEPLTPSSDYYLSISYVQKVDLHTP